MPTRGSVPPARIPPENTWPVNQLVTLIKCLKFQQLLKKCNRSIPEKKKHGMKDECAMNVTAEV